MKSKIKKSWDRFLKFPVKCPYFFARSFMVGMGLAFAPFPGQVPVIFGLWVLLKRTKYKFSLVISVALSFISNVFTNVPLFYLYYLTGNLLLTRSLKLDFKMDSWQNIYTLWSEIGTSFLTGSIFYMITFGLLGYYLGFLIGKKKVASKK